VRDLAARVPVHVADQLRAAVTVLAERVPEVAIALHDLGRYGLLADLAMQVPGSLAPAELAEPEDDELEAAADRLLITFGWHVVQVIEAAVCDAERPTLPT
jgi:hypothetical protein